MTYDPFSQCTDGLPDFAQGDTPAWHISFEDDNGDPYDVAGATVIWAFKDSSRDTDAQAFCTGTGTLDAPDGLGKVYGATIQLTEAQSKAIPVRDKVFYGIRIKTADNKIASLEFSRDYVRVTQPVPRDFP